MVREERQRRNRGRGPARRQFRSGEAGALTGTVVAGDGRFGSPKEAEPLVGRVLGPGSVNITLDVNGRRRDLAVEPRATLLEALREDLHLTGTKSVCDLGECGACTVLLDDRAVYACLTLAIEARSRRITTIEGLSPDGKLHPVQQAFVETDGLQCGFCTPGQVMASVALLSGNPNPTPEEIRAGLAGNTCRCGAYPKIFEAVAAAAARMRKQA